MARTTMLLLLVLLSALMLAAGCSSPEARDVARPETDHLASTRNEEDGFQAQITLSRKVSRKSGRPIGEGTVFHPAARSYVHGLADFTGVQLGRTYVIHLVWVRPDGKELFRKYAEAIQERDERQELRTILTWLDAEDLHDVARDTISAEGAAFRLQSRLNISEKRQRDPGQYGFRVYLDRRFLLEKTFEVTGEEETGD